MNQVIREGFLCPRCKCDFGSPNELLGHESECNFIESSNDESGFWKPPNTTLGSFAEYEAMRLRREDVPTRSWTDAFKKERSGCSRHTTLETNRLIFRLERLVKSLSRDASPTNMNSVQSRSLHMVSNALSKFGVSFQKENSEERVCDWLPDADRPYCGRCLTRFSFQRRKHHCRLCGEVICDDCSLFLTYSDAKNLVALNSLANTDDIALSSPTRLSTRTSATSPADQGEATNETAAQPNEAVIRICSNCCTLLEARKRQRSAGHDWTLLNAYRSIQTAINQLLAVRKEFDTTFESAATNHFRNAAERMRLEDLRRDVVAHTNDLDRIANECYPQARIADANTNDNSVMRVRRNLRALAIETSRDVRFTLKPIPSNRPK